MELAKPRIDVGLFTTSLEPMLDFWQNEIGLPLDHVLPLGGGMQQHRHDLLGSVLKINHSRNALPVAPPSGYRELLIAREGLLGPKRLTDPDGNKVTLVPPGAHGIERIGIRLGIEDQAATRWHKRWVGITGLWVQAAYGTMPPRSPAGKMRAGCLLSALRGPPLRLHNGWRPPLSAIGRARRRFWAL